MLAELISIKFIILYCFILSAIYIHYRGSVRYKFLRQLTDHSTFMAPINTFMYSFSAIPRTPYLDASLFPELTKIKENWQMIRDEALELTKDNHICASDKYNDIGFNSFFRTGWKRFYLKWYGDPLPSAKELCPKTTALLKEIPSINAAMFAMLPPGSRLVRHRDPYAGSIRYHLGLITPNSPNCYIDVDGTQYYWKNGEEVLFDETYIHYAENTTDINRIILFCDIQRPLTNRFAMKVNQLFSKYIMSATSTQNLEGDSVGFINKAFKYLYQIRLVGKRLKKFNRNLYYAVKYALFLGIFYLVFLLR